MKKTVPPAEHFRDNGDYTFFERDGELRWDTIYRFAADFAKAHVERAKEEIGNKIKEGFPAGGDIIKAGVLEAYPLSNIKE